MIKQALGVFALSSATAIATLWGGSVSTARADTFCGTSSSGASVFAGNSETSCNFLLSTRQRPTAPMESAHNPSASTVP